MRANRPEPAALPASNAFLLTQLGTAAANRYAQRVAELGLIPPHVGLLSVIAAAPGQSQQHVAETLGIVPSRLVALLDDLEERGVLRRVRSSTDRRVFELHLTDDGHRLLASLAQIGSTHDDEFCAGLDRQERHQLHRLLERLAQGHDLTPGVHPGFRHLGPPGS